MLTVSCHFKTIINEMNYAYIELIILFELACINPGVGQPYTKGLGGLLQLVNI